jgi:hypothetical protein
MKLYNHDGTKEYEPCGQYNWRLDWLENQIKLHRTNGRDMPEHQYDRWFSEEEKVYQNNLKDYEKIKKLDKDIGIIIPTHKYHAVWSKACFKSCSETGYWTMVAYDNPYYGINHKHENLLPTVEAMMYADEILMKPKTWGSGVGIPHSWNMYLGLKMIKSLGFSHVFNTNGDCILEKPEGVDVLYDMLKKDDSDMIACEYDPGRYLGTMTWLAKTDVALKLWEMNFKNLYRNQLGNAEARMGIFAKKLGLKVISVVNPADHHFKDWTHKNTFREVVGIRHLHAEHKVRRWDKKAPIEEKYFDKNFLNTHERNTLLKYWETDDKKYLKQWWG